MGDFLRGEGKGEVTPCQESSRLTIADNSNSNFLFGTSALLEWAKKQDSAVALENCFFLASGSSVVRVWRQSGSCSSSLRKLQNCIELIHKCSFLICIAVKENPLWCSAPCHHSRRLFVYQEYGRINREFMAQGLV